MAAASGTGTTRDMSAAEVEALLTGAVVNDDPRQRRRKRIRWAAIGVAVAIATAMCATRGLSPWEVEARVADVVREQPNGTARQLAAAIAVEFADSGASFSDGEGTPFNAVTDSGIAGAPIVRRVSEGGMVRVAVVYAEASFIPGGTGSDMYCLVVDVPLKGATSRTRVEADFSRPDHCAHAQAEVAAAR